MITFLCGFAVGATCVIVLAAATLKFIVSSVKGK
jgi:hypothetical protein